MDLASLISHPAPAVKSNRGDYFSASTSYKRTAPQPPLSPPAEEQPKCSLPSISTLIESADSAPARPAKRQRTSPPAQECDPRIQSQGYEPSRLPPTPPLRPGSGFHTTTAGHSPSGSVASADGNKSQEQGHVALPSPADNRASVSSQGSQPQQQHLSGPYASPAPSVPSYSSPVELPASSAMYYQRAPASFPPPQGAASIPAPQMIPSLTPTWQHHHYFPSSSAAAPYQQNHDRYICRTCHKAFSRPSSLRIHSHSHTGEKPFRCTHAGCGKAFSVRSNMKRHERGCHSARPIAAATTPTAVV